MKYKSSLAVGMTPEGDSIGWASTYGNVDRVNEAVDRGAYFQAPYVDMPTLAYHDAQRPVGTSLLTDEPYGLYDVTKFVPGDADADKIRNLVRHKAVPAMSVGYNEIDTALDSRGVRHLMKLELLEVSFVPIPANAEARVLAAKGFGSHVPHALRQGMKSLFGESPDRWSDAEEMIHSKQLDSVADPDEDPVELAEAVDALLDTIAAELSAGNVDQADSLVVAALVTADALIEALGGTDADEPADESGEPPEKRLSRRLRQKRGARNSTMDQKALDAAHAALVAAGANCSPVKAAIASAIATDKRLLMKTDEARQMAGFSSLASDLLLYELEGLK